MKQHLLCLCLCLLSSPWVYAQDDKTGAPYFIVQGKDAKAVDFPLTHVATDVQIVGVIADVTIRQVYQNKSPQTLEAVYVFPASTKSAVYAMQMQVGKKRVKAQIKERSQARETYEQAKTEGKTASLLEQDRANIFRMSVANILPNDSIVVELRYTELVTPEAGEYEFVLPTVVAPRYQSVYDEPSATNGLPTTAPVERKDYQKAGELPTYTYAFNMRIATGVPVEKVYSPSHKISTAPNTEGEQEVVMTEPTGGNKDIVVRYALRGEQIQQGLLAYKEEGEKFFLYMAQPPKPAVKVEPTPREYIFVVDVSGSMSGFPLRVSKELISNLLAGLKPTDKFNILFFAGGNQTLHESSVEASKSNIKRAQEMLIQIEGGGGTEILPAVERAMTFPRQEGYARSFVILTDGFISIEKKVFQTIRNSLGDANFFSFGIGASVNRLLIEGMAFAGNAEPVVVLNEAEAQKASQKFLHYINNPLLTDIKIDFGDMQVYDQEPKRFPDLFAEKPIIVFGKYKGELQGQISLSGRQGGKTINQTQDLAKTKPKNKNQAIRYLWARERIKLLSDYNVNGFYGYKTLANSGDEIQEITRLGLQYNLLTDYTSFVAVYDKVRNEEPQKDSTITQPLPLPEGVSDLAQSGGKVGAASYVGFVSGIQYSDALNEVTVTGYGVINREKLVGSITSVVSKNVQQIISERFVTTISGATFGQESVITNGYRLQGNLASVDNAYFFKHDLQLSPTLYRQMHGLNWGYDNPIRRIEFTPLIEGRNKKGALHFQTTHYLENALALKKNFTFGNKWATRVYASGTWNPLSIDRNGDEFLDTPQGYSIRYLQDWRYKTLKTDLKLAYQYTHIDQKQGHAHTQLPLALQNQSDNTGVALDWAENVGKGEFILRANYHTYNLNRHTTGSTTLDDAVFQTGKENKWNIESGYRFYRNGHSAEAKLTYTHDQINESLYQVESIWGTYLQRTESVVGTYLRYAYEQEGGTLTWSIHPTLRIDKHNLFGWLVSPELAGKVRLWDNLHFNALAGKRYRTANIIAENAQYWASPRQIIMSEMPNIEKSWYYNIGTSYYGRISENLRISPSLSYQRTDYQNLVIADAFATSQAVFFSNLQGRAFQSLLLGKLGIDGKNWGFDVVYQWQRFRATYSEKLRDVPFNPTAFLKTSAYLDINKIKGGTLRPTVSWIYTGKQTVPFPNYFEEPRAYHTLDARLQYIKPKWEASIGCENIGDFRLQQPIRYDASQLWATTLGRRAFASVLWKF
jgi:Ca-activated chloride channel family protein